MQELAEGRSLADLVASGWRADEAEVARIARELLEVRPRPVACPSTCKAVGEYGCCHHSSIRTDKSFRCILLELFGQYAVAASITQCLLQAPEI